MRRPDAPTEAADVAIAWLQHLWAGRAEELDWLTTRTCEIELAGPNATGEGLDRGGVVELADAFGEAFEDTVLSFGTLYQREHEVRVEVSVQTTHAGPLDLTPLGGGRYPATGQRLLLVDQTVAWQILHKRVHGFEVRQGRGLGVEQLTRALGLDRQASGVEERSRRGPTWAGTNGEHGVQPEQPAAVPLAKATMDGTTQTSSRLPEPDLEPPGSSEETPDAEDTTNKTPDAEVPGIDELRDRVDSVIDEHL